MSDPRDVTHFCKCGGGCPNCAASVHPGTDRVELTEDERCNFPHPVHPERLCERPAGHDTHSRPGDAWVTDHEAWQALTAERDRLQRDIDTLTHDNATVGVLNYIAEKQKSERESTTYIHKLQAELAAANAKISKWAEDYKKLAHDCGGTELERQALAARCAELEAAVEQEITTRDQYADLLDRFAAAIPGDHGEHSSGNDPWTNALESAADLQATLDRVTALADEQVDEMGVPYPWAKLLRAALTQEGKP